MLCEALASQARDENVQQASVEPVHDYIDDPQSMGDTQKIHDTM